MQTLRPVEAGAKRSQLRPRYAAVKTRLVIILIIAGAAATVRRQQDTTRSTQQQAAFVPGSVRARTAEP